MMNFAGFPCDLKVHYFTLEPNFKSRLKSVIGKILDKEAKSELLFAYNALSFIFLVGVWEK